MKTLAKANRVGTFGVAAGLIAAAAVMAQLGGLAPRGVRAQDGLLVGTLEGREARVAVYATADGTRYEIRGLDGTLVAANLTAADVGQLLPGQDPRGVFAEETAKTGPLMLAEPRHFERD